MEKILRLRAAKDWTGLSRSTIYLMMRAGTFPKNILLGARAVGWHQFNRAMPSPSLMHSFKQDQATLLQKTWL